MKLICRINKNHMSQFKKLDGFVVFNSSRILDNKIFHTYEITIRKLNKTKNQLSKIKLEKLKK